MNYKCALRNAEFSEALTFQTDKREMFVLLFKEDCRPGSEKQCFILLFAMDVCPLAEFTLRALAHTRVFVCSFCLDLGMKTWFLDSPRSVTPFSKVNFGKWG
jgi:hypothetical protein